MESPSLEMLKNCLDISLCNMLKDGILERQDQVTQLWSLSFGEIPLKAGHVVKLKDILFAGKEDGSTVS